MFIVLHEELGLSWGAQIPVLQGRGIITQWRVLSTFADGVTIGGTLGNDLPFTHFVNILDLLLRNNVGTGKMSLLLISGTSEIFFFLLTWMTEAAVCDYKFWLGFLAMQEESNPLWFNNFLPHFGTTANTCTEVSPSTDHQDVRWQSSCAELMQISAESLLSLESMTGHFFYWRRKRKKWREEEEWSFDQSPYWPVSSEITNHLNTLGLKALTSKCVISSRDASVITRGKYSKYFV